MTDTKYTPAEFNRLFTPPTAEDHEKKEAGEARTEKAAGGNIYTPEYIASLFLPTETE